jgi:nucleoside-diphosphate-sugar epimerase
VRVLVTGGSGVLGRAAVPRLRAAGHDVIAPARTELDLFDPAAAEAALAAADAVLHLATRIPPPDARDDPEAWHENDRLRSDASRILVDAALRRTTSVYVQPTVAFVYAAADEADEETPLGDVPATLRSALDAEAEASRFTAAGRRGVVLRFGLLDGPGPATATSRTAAAATLHVADAGRALVAALDVPSGIYNVCRDNERVSNRRFKRASGWRPAL